MRLNDRVLRTDGRTHTQDRIDIHKRALAGHGDDIVRIETTPRDASPEVVPGYDLCR